MSKENEYKERLERMKNKGIEHTKRVMAQKISSRPEAKNFIKAMGKESEARRNPLIVAKRNKLEKTRRAEFLHKHQAKVEGGVHGRISTK